MIDLLYELHGDIPEAGAVVPVLLDGSTVVHAEDILTLFPFEGMWCFRVLEQGLKYGQPDEYVWVDLEAGMVFAFEEGNKRLRIRALPVVLAALDPCQDDSAVLDDYVALCHARRLVGRGPRLKVDPKAERFWSVGTKKSKTVLQKVLGKPHTHTYTLPHKHSHSHT
jgi:hypothetical protein